jgi:hypothetical protein
MESTEKSPTSSNPNFLRPLAVPLPSVPESSEPTKIVDHPREASEPIDAYEQKMGRPYLVDVLEVHSLYNHELWHDKIDHINSEVMENLTSKGLENTKRAYRSVFEQMLKDANIDELTDFDKKIERLSAYLSVMQKQRSIDKLKRELGIDGN